MKFNKGRIFWFCLLCFAFFILAACTLATTKLFEIPERNYGLETWERVIIDLPSGSVEIFYSNINHVILSGLFPENLGDGLVVEENDSGLSIHLSDQAQGMKRSLLNQVSLKITVPIQTHVEISTFDASVSATGVGADLSITSVGGLVSIHVVEGKALVKANRGAVSISNSNGSFTVFGNYGDISFSQVTGEITSSTIMGQISYFGEPAVGDRIHFETDHGPVALKVPLSANLAVAMSSVSGEVTCIFPSLENSSRSCQGVLGLGQADLFVRSVSGRVTLQRGALTQ